MNSEKDKILEGEVVGKEPEKVKHSHKSGSVPPQFKVFTLALQKLKRNCLLASIAFFTCLILAIYFKNGWFVLLAFLVPPWLFAQK